MHKIIKQSILTNSALIIYPVHVGKKGFCLLFFGEMKPLSFRLCDSIVSMVQLTCFLFNVVDFHDCYVNDVNLLSYIFVGICRDEL